MNISRFNCITLVTLSIVFYSNIVNSANADSSVRIQTGLMNYEFEQKAFFGIKESTQESRSSSKQKLSDAMPFFGVGVTFFISDFYIDLSAQSSFSGSDSDIVFGQDVEPVGGGSFNLVPFSRPIDTDWDRNEYSFTLGYAVTKRFKLYTGYTRSESTFEQTGTSTNLITDFSLAFKDDLKYTQQGVIIGGSYAWSLDQSDTFQLLKGALSVNAGLAFIDGTIDESFKFEGESAVKTKREGDTVGLSLGVAWNGHVGQFMGNDFYYSLGVNGYKYDFEANNASQDADFSETVTRYSLGLSMPISF